MLLIAADGTTQQSIVEPGEDIGTGAWSPDESRLAYLRHVADDPEQDVLVLALPDGSSPVDVQTPMYVNSLPAWSPDGSTIALRSARGDALVIVQPTGGVDGTAVATPIPQIDMVGDPVFQPLPVAIPSQALASR
jgi:Tol biopolymer transport system component